MAERKIRDEAILLPISSSVGELGTVYDLNASAARIWNLARQGSPESAIVDHLAKEYEAPREQIAQDVAAILDHLVRLRILLPA